MGQQLAYSMIMFALRSEYCSVIGDLRYSVGNEPINPCSLANGGVVFESHEKPREREVSNCVFREMPGIQCS